MLFKLFYKPLQEVLTRKYCNEFVLLSNFHTSYFVLKKSTFENPYENQLKSIRHKKTHHHTVSLIDVDGSVSLKNFFEAEKYAVNCNMKLVQIDDKDAVKRGNNIPVFMLMSGKELYEEKMKSKSIKAETAPKKEKTLMLKETINLNDLQRHLKTTLSWLEKNWNTRVIVSRRTEDAAKSHEIVKMFESSINEKNGRILQVVDKANSLRFIVSPAKKEKEGKVKKEEAIEIREET